MYEFLAAVTCAVLIGMAIGFKIFSAVLNRHMDAGDMDIYIKGRRIEHIGMW
jgi:hypothetical protein